MLCIWGVGGSGKMGGSRVVLYWVCCGYEVGYELGVFGGLLVVGYDLVGDGSFVYVCVGRKCSGDCGVFVC